MKLVPETFSLTTKRRKSSEERKILFYKRPYFILCISWKASKIVQATSFSIISNAKKISKKVVCLCNFLGFSFRGLFFFSSFVRVCALGLLQLQNLRFGERKKAKKGCDERERERRHFFWDWDRSNTSRLVSMYRMIMMAIYINVSVSP